MKPSALKVVNIILEKFARKMVAQVPMSNNFIKNRIVDMSHNALEQVMNDIMENTMTMSLQLDEYTDVSHCSQLTTVVQYVKSEKY